MSYRALFTIPLLCCVIACGQPLGCQRATTVNDVEPSTAPRSSPQRVHTFPKRTRQLWLRKQFMMDHKMLLKRAPELTQGKFLKMAQSPYNYFRGSANIALRDATSPDGLKALAQDNVPSILLAGDPHPENFGTFRLPNGNMTIDLNDFDTAMTGPYLWDIHRLGVGFGMLWMMAQAQGLMNDDDLPVLLNIVAKSYLDELLAQGSASQLKQTFSSKKEAKLHAGAIYADLIKRAVKDGDKREALSDYTTKEKGKLVLHRGILEPSTHDLIARDVLVDASPELIALVDTTRKNYLSTLHSKSKNMALGAPLDIARRLGAGVGSYPVERLYVLYPNDVLLEYKEIPTPFTTQGFSLPPHTSQAQRAVGAQRALQSNPNSDQWLGHVHNKEMSMKVRQRTKYQKGIKIERMLEEAKNGEWSMEDLHTFARTSARILARAHMRTSATALRPVLKTIKARPGVWLKSAQRHMEQGTHQTMRDYGMFVDTLKPDGSFDMSNTSGP